MFCTCAVFKYVFRFLAKLLNHHMKTKHACLPCKELWKGKIYQAFNEFELIYVGISKPVSAAIITA